MSINRLNIAEHLVEYQLEMVGRTIAEAKKMTCGILIGQ